MKKRGFLVLALTGMMFVGQPAGVNVYATEASENSDINVTALTAEDEWELQLAGTGQDTSVELVWDGTADTSWYQENQTEFVLTTPEQLAGLEELVNSGNTFAGKKILLGADMRFNEEDSYLNVWTPIAAASGQISFQGTFDGQGHTLFNLFTSGTDGGLFGVIGADGVVKAVTVSGGLIEGAAIAYQNQGWILFCKNESTIYEEHDLAYIGGICGRNFNLIYGCGNEGSVEGSYSAGGIVGINQATAASIDSCWNQGTVMGGSFEAAGIAAANYGWVYDCYNAGTVSGYYGRNPRILAGIVANASGENIDTNERVYNCYNRGDVIVEEEEGFGWAASTSYKYGKNLYSLPAEYLGIATEVTLDELRSTEALSMLKGEKGIGKWCMDEDNLNDGCLIPTAQRDMENGDYRMLPDVWYPKTKVSISMSDNGYQLKAYRYAYYGMQEIDAVYSSDSENLSITSEGKITPLRPGTAVVNVIFPETEYGKESGFEVTVTIEGLLGDLNADDRVDITDLMMCLHHVSGRTILSGQALGNADVDGNGMVNITDLMRLLHFVSGRNDTL